jgi:hypothetical protein
MIFQTNNIVKKLYVCMTASAVRNSLILCSEKNRILFQQLMYIVCMLLLYKFTTFFWDSESFIHFFALFYTLTEKIYFLTPPTPRETPQKMLFYSAAIQHSFNGGKGASLVCCCFAFIFFPFPPAPSSSFRTAARANRRETPTH